MRIKRTDAGNEPELDKAEVRCLMDAAAIIEAADAINLKPRVSRKAAELSDAEAEAIVEEAAKDPDEPITGLS